MVRKLITSSLLILLITTGAQAGGLIRGSDTFVQSQNTAESIAVANGIYRETDPAALETRLFGYALKDGQDGGEPGFDSPRDAPAQDAAPSLHGTGRSASTVDSWMMPDSDSF